MLRTGWRGDNYVISDGNVWAVAFSGSQCPFNTLLNGPHLSHTLGTAALAAVDFAEPGARPQEAPYSCRTRMNRM